MSVKHLEQQHLEAELATVQALLEERSEEVDPIGWAHFSARVRELEDRLTALEQAPETTASVAVFFGGRPVVGSRGIEAEFGGKALEEFENAVSTQLAAIQGAVGARGPIPQRARGQLLLTDVTRGSFGFLFEEAENSLVETPLKSALDDVVELIQQVASPDEEIFEGASELVDPRVLGSMRSFLKLVDDAGATLRIVEGDRDVSLPRQSIEIARKRVDELEIHDEPTLERGVLYLLPDSRRFELHRADDSVLRGTLSSEAAEALIDPSGKPRPNLIGSTVEINLSRRRITALGREPRFSYRLLGTA